MLERGLAMNKNVEYQFVDLTQLLNMVHLYIVDLLSKNGDFPVRYVGLPESKKIG